MRFILPLFITLSFAYPAELLAQKNDPTMKWDHEIVVIQNSLSYRDTVLPALSFTVFEADQARAMELWRNDHSTKSASITKGKVAVARNTSIPDLSAQPLQVITIAKGDKRTGNATLSIAIRPDSIPQEKQQVYVRGLAVKYNRAVVEAQIANEARSLEKARSALGKSASKDNKLKADLQKTKASLNKLEAQRTKQQKNNAEMQGDIAGAEQKYVLTGDVKDLKKLTKHRRKLSQGETKVARIMEKEAKLNSTATKYSGDLPDSANAKEDREKGVAHHEQRMEALRSKLNDIR